MNDRADIKRTASTNNSQPARSDGRLYESDVSNRSEADYFKPISDMQMPKAVALRPPKRRPIAYQPTFWYGLMMLVLAYLGLMSLLNYNLFGHAVHDSFTLMAMSWRQGSLSLINGENYPYLELAIHNGNYYVSFPSVPALIMLPLTFIFGENTPNTLMTFIYFMVAYMAAYKTCSVYRKPIEAMCLALFMTLGCNMLQFSLSGGVWNQGQLTSFMFTSLFAAGITGRRKSGWAWGLICLALAVGCRPFQAVYVPLGLWLLYRKLSKNGGRVRATLLSMIPYLIVPALIALALGWYNYARFGSPIEFGHNYLPEHTRDPNEPMMGFKYIWKNIVNLLRLPEFNENRLEFTNVQFSGFAFYLANPIYVTLIITIVLKTVRRKWDIADLLLIAGIVVHLTLLLMHKTLGGWQFGARYLCDVIPMILFFCVRWRRHTSGWEYPIMIFAIAFNIYGAACFHLVSGGY